MERLGLLRNQPSRSARDAITCTSRNASAPLHEAIETLRSAERLKPDAAARLAHYEKHEARLAWERQKIEREIDDLVLEESERQMCEFSPAGFRFACLSTDNSGM